jgi:hypothetical protein
MKVISNAWFLVCLSYRIVIWEQILRFLIYHSLCFPFKNYYTIIVIAIYLGKVIVVISEGANSLDFRVHPSSHNYCL